MSELGIETPRRYISDEITSWYFEADFNGIYCVEEIKSSKGKAKTHTWDCTEHGCQLTSCKVSKCDDIEVSVLKKDISDTDLLDNCGDAIRITMPKTDGKLLDFDYYGISEVITIGDPLNMEPTPTSMAYYDPVNLEIKCPSLGENYIIHLYQSSPILLPDVAI